jgi:hypothetical protein
MIATLSYFIHLFSLSKHVLALHGHPQVYLMPKLFHCIVLLREARIKLNEKLKVKN